MIQRLKQLFCNDEEYDVCETHGHDFRESEFSGFRVENREVNYPAHFEELPNLGYPKSWHDIMEVYTQHCRDCPAEREETERRRLIFVYEDDTGNEILFTEEELQQKIKNVEEAEYEE